MAGNDLTLEDPINKQTYLSPKVIDFYSQNTDLQPPEKTIVQILAPMLSNAKMLDVGVGAGRTTEYFAPIVKSYTAFDFSAGMIDQCKAKYAARFPEAR